MGLAMSEILHSNTLGIHKCVKSCQSVHKMVLKRPFPLRKVLESMCSLLSSSCLERLTETKHASTTRNSWRPPSTTISGTARCPHQHRSVDHFASVWTMMNSRITENTRSAIWQICHHWGHRQLSLRQLTVPPVTTKFSNCRPFVFINKIMGCNISPVLQLTCGLAKP